MTSSTSARQSGELTQRLVWLPPPPPAKRSASPGTPAHRQQLVPDPNPGADLRGLMVVVVVAVLVAAALVLAYWLSAPLQTPVPG